jgi:hypothetical protein
MTSKIIPLLEEDSKEDIKGFAEELSKYIKISKVEEPIIISKNARRKRLQSFFNFINNFTWEKSLISVPMLEEQLKQHRERFYTKFTFMPSYVRLYEEEAFTLLNGRFIKKFDACYVFLHSEDPVASAIHEFGHASGLVFDYEKKHPETTCVMKLPIKTREFCGYCREKLSGTHV